MANFSALSKKTTILFTEWQSHLIELSTNLGTDLVITPSKHAEEKYIERSIKTGQIQYILRNKFNLKHIQRSTRLNCFKFRVIGNDFDNKKIEIVIIPGKKGYKIITAFYSKN
jgi:hypothetical protein